MSRFAVLFSLALFAAGGLAPAARADLIFFKDGFVLQGNVRREGSTEFDSSSKDFHWVPKGFFLVDDGPRRVYFSPNRVSIVERMTAPADERIVRREMALILNPRPMLPIDEVMDVQEWDYKAWKREFSFRTSNDTRVVLRQQIAELTPYFARVDAITKFRWSAGYMTRELDPRTVLKLLRSHPELQDDYLPPRPKLPAPKVEKDKSKSGPKDEKPPAKLDPEKEKELDRPTAGMVVARRMRICDFCAQAGWFDLADEELTRLVKDFPDQKKRVEEGRALVQKLRSREQWEQVKHWYQAGRYDAVGKRLEKLPTKDVPDRILADRREMQAKIEADRDTVKQSLAALASCAKEVKTAAGKSLASAVPVLAKEVHPSSVGRLDAFLGQAREADRQKARGKKPPYNPDELLALAVTGWLLGSSSAEPRPDAAVNLWKTRQMVLAYCGEDDVPSRKKILAAYEKEVTPKVDLDEVAQLVGSLPPVDPGKITDDVMEVKTGKGRNPTTYKLKLPPEYTHSRPYPVLIVLKHIGEKDSTAMERWEKYAADQGYILAVPDWAGRFGNMYLFTPEEHDKALDTLRDLKRRYQIDSDRVFLFGLGEGGKMAFDVGLSHPDLFAGVIPMGAGPRLFPARYWRNAQYLPFYVVNGTRAGSSNEPLRDQFTNWIQRGFPALWVEYKGRGLEFLAGEVPNIFDWMRNQQRIFPLRQLGSDGNGSVFGNEFCTMRPEDNRFYWLSTSDVAARHAATAERWSNQTSPALLTGRIDATTNEIVVRGTGLGQMSVWLGRSPRGENMIDFERKVFVRAGLKPVFNDKVKPNLGVMLEDLAKRGDRKHLYLARIDINLR